MSPKADSRLAEFLRRVLAAGGDASPVAVIFGDGAVAESQESMALQFAAAVRETGHVEPVEGAGLRRVRVTEAGREWLADYDGRSRDQHPRFSS
ncbi:hypothetical protein [Pseudonocardia spirodelae]|uniref:Uncharacterized protein n=1 Tax=Pseudonocardia spirodelae TaxID=3133431 RepID=A0ABU8TAC7_9PSEU